MTDRHVRVHFFPTYQPAYLVERSSTPLLNPESRRQNALLPTTFLLTYLPPLPECSVRSRKNEYDSCPVRRTAGSLQTVSIHTGYNGWITAVLRTGQESYLFFLLRTLHSGRGGRQVRRNVVGSKAFCRRDSGLGRGVELRSTKYAGWYVEKKLTRICLSVTPVCR